MVRYAKLRGRLVVVVTLVMAFYQMGYPCSLPKKWNIQKVGQRAAFADIVIVGKVIASSRSHAKAKKRKFGPYTARFMVLCTLKGAPLPEFIDVSGFGLVPGHCAESRALMNRTYIGLLRKYEGKYSVAEVNMQPGTMTFKAHILRRVAHKLGLEEPRYCLTKVFDSGRRETKKLVRNLGSADAETQSGDKRTRTVETFSGGTSGGSRKRYGQVWVLSLLVYYLFNEFT